MPKLDRAVLIEPLSDSGEARDRQGLGLSRAGGNDMNDLYEKDLYAWTQAQGDALRRRAFNEVDWDNVAEEIETLGRSEKRAIASRLEVLLTHLLK
jgi:hypothetical protein